MNGATWHRTGPVGSTAVPSALPTITAYRTQEAHRRSRFSGPGRLPRLGVAAGAVVLSLAVAGAALATSVNAIHIFTPTSADQVTNIDILRMEIANYYGDPAKSGTFSPDSNYAREASSVAADGAHWLAAKANSQAPSGMKAIVLDVDDTTLATWNYEVFSNWAYNPTTNATYVLGQLFPAVPGMVGMVSQAKAEGYAVFFITGRPDSQHVATLGNLGADGTGIDAGYPAPTAVDIGHGGFTDGLFTKPSVGSYPAYLDKPEFCAAAIDADKSCATIPYKAGTRAYIESLGYEIVADFGDQYSDLLGGYADKTFKMPNPNYYLP